MEGGHSMSKPVHISVEDLTRNLAELLNKVRTEQTSIVVEYANGENVLIKPYSPARRRTRKKQRTGSAPPSNQPPAKETSDKENVSAVGAVYDLDPGSITPG
jgi:hypothetical protein